MPHLKRVWNEGILYNSDVSLVQKVLLGAKASEFTRLGFMTWLLRIRWYFLVIWTGVHIYLGLLYIRNSNGSPFILCFHHTFKWTFQLYIHISCERTQVDLMLGTCLEILLKRFVKLTLQSLSQNSKGKHLFSIT